MDTKKFSLGISILLVAVFVTPLLLKQPALWSVFDLSRDSNLATSISGFITPVLTFLSIILIFFAFTKQIEANKELHEQTLNSNKQVQIEIINSLLNQINNEINSYAHLKNDEPFVGRLAFQEIGDMVMNGVKKNDKLVLSDYAYGEALVSVANLYLLIFKEINNGILSANQCESFYIRTVSHLRSLAGVPFFKSWLAYRRKPEYFDHTSLVIIKLVETYFPNRFEVMQRSGID